MPKHCNYPNYLNRAHGPILPIDLSKALRGQHVEINADIVPDGQTRRGGGIIPNAPQTEQQPVDPLANDPNAHMLRFMLRNPRSRSGVIGPRSAATLRRYMHSSKKRGRISHHINELPTLDYTRYDMAQGPESHLNYTNPLMPTAGIGNPNLTFNNPYMMLNKKLRKISKQLPNYTGAMDPALGNLANDNGGIIQPAQNQNLIEDIEDDNDNHIKIEDVPHPPGGGGGGGGGGHPGGGAGGAGGGGGGWNNNNNDDDDDSDDNDGDGHNGGGGGAVANILNPHYNVFNRNHQNPLQPKRKNARTLAAMDIASAFDILNQNATDFSRTANLLIDQTNKLEQSNSKRYATLDGQILNFTLRNKEIQKQLDNLIKIRDALLKKINERDADYETANKKLNDEATRMTGFNNTFDAANTRINNASAEYEANLENIANLNTAIQELQESLRDSAVGARNVYNSAVNDASSLGSFYDQQQRSFLNAQNDLDKSRNLANEIQARYRQLANIVDQENSIYQKIREGNVNLTISPNTKQQYEKYQQEKKKWDEIEARKEKEEQISKLRAENRNLEDQIKMQKELNQKTQEEKALAKQQEIERKKAEAEALRQQKQIEKEQALARTAAIEEEKRRQKQAEKEQKEKDKAQSQLLIEEAKRKKQLQKEYEKEQAKQRPSFLGKTFSAIFSNEPPDNKKSTDENSESFLSRSFRALLEKIPKQQQEEQEQKQEQQEQNKESKKDNFDKIADLLEEEERKKRELEEEISEGEIRKEYQYLLSKSKSGSYDNDNDDEIMDNNDDNNEERPKKKSFIKSAAKTFLTNAAHLANSTKSILNNLNLSKSVDKETAKFYKSKVEAINSIPVEFSAGPRNASCKEEYPTAVKWVAERLSELHHMDPNGTITVDQDDPNIAPYIHQAASQYALSIVENNGGLNSQVILDNIRNRIVNQTWQSDIDADQDTVMEDIKKAEDAVETVLNYMDEVKKDYEDKHRQLTLAGSLALKEYVPFSPESSSYWSDSSSLSSSQSSNNNHNNLSPTLTRDILSSQANYEITDKTLDELHNQTSNLYNELQRSGIDYQTPPVFNADRRIKEALLSDPDVATEIISDSRLKIVLVNVFKELDNTCNNEVLNQVCNDDDGILTKDICQMYDITPRQAQATARVLRELRCQLYKEDMIHMRALLHQRQSLTDTRTLSPTPSSNTVSPAISRLDLTPSTPNPYPKQSQLKQNAKTIAARGSSPLTRSALVSNTPLSRSIYDLPPALRSAALQSTVIDSGIETNNKNDEENARDETGYNPTVTFEEDAKVFTMSRPPNITSRSSLFYNDASTLNQSSFTASKYDPNQNAVSKLDKTQRQELTTFDQLPNIQDAPPNFKDENGKQHRTLYMGTLRDVIKGGIYLLSKDPSVSLTNFNGKPLSGPISKQKALVHLGQMIMDIVSGMTEDERKRVRNEDIMRVLSHPNVLTPMVANNVFRFHANSLRKDLQEVNGEVIAGHELHLQRHNEEGFDPNLSGVRRDKWIWFYEHVLNKLRPGSPAHELYINLIDKCKYVYFNPMVLHDIFERCILSRANNIGMMDAWFKSKNNPNNRPEAEWGPLQRGIEYSTLFVMFYKRLADGFSTSKVTTADKTFIKSFMPNENFGAALNYISLCNMILNKIPTDMVDDIYNYAHTLYKKSVQTDITKSGYMEIRKK